MQGSPNLIRLLAAGCLLGSFLSGSVGATDHEVSGLRQPAVPGTPDTILVCHYVIDFDCRFRDDTLYLAVLEEYHPAQRADTTFVRSPRPLSLRFFSLADDSLSGVYTCVDNTDCKRVWLCEGLKAVAISPELMITVEPFQEEVYPERYPLEWHKDWASSPVAYLAGPDTDYFIYRDYSYRRMQLAMDNIDRQYSKQYLRRIGARGDTEAELIRPGRVDCRDFVCYRSGDTIYAAWLEGRRQPVAWSDGGHYERSIVFSRYDGRSWEDPVTVVSYREIGDDIFASPCELVSLDGKPCLLWMESGSSDDEDGRHLLLSRQGANGEWAPIDSNTLACDFVVGNQLFLTVTDSEGTLHVVTGLPGDRQQMQYAVLDGFGWHMRRAIAHESGMLKLVVDAENRAWLLRAYNSRVTGEGYLVLMLLSDN